MNAEKPECAQCGSYVRGYAHTKCLKCHRTFCDDHCHNYATDHVPRGQCVFCTEFNECADDESGLCSSSICENLLGDGKTCCNHTTNTFKDCRLCRRNFGPVCF
jgi:hypothetical protein